MRESLWRRIVVRPFLELLRQGLTPEKIAFTVALGIMLGVTPVLGSTVLLCTLAAIVFRLNLPAIQLVNWLVYPLQLVLLVPLLRIGAWLFGRQPSEISVAHIFELIRTDVFHAVATLWMATTHALVAWLAFGSLAAVLIYLLLVPVLHRVQSEVRRAAGEKPCSR